MQRPPRRLFQQLPWPQQRTQQHGAGGTARPLRSHLRKLNSAFDRSWVQSYHHHHHHHHRGDGAQPIIGRNYSQRIPLSQVGQMVMDDAPNDAPRPP